MSFPRYPKYKASGVEWLGEVPDGWEVKRARAVGVFSSSGIDKKSVDGEQEVQMFNYLDVYKSPDKILRYSEDLMWTTAPASKVAEHSVMLDDILLTPSSETADDIGHAARVTSVPPNILYSYHILRFRKGAGFDASFVTHCFNAVPIRSYFESVCTGTTRKVLVRDDFKNAPFAIPPLPEQTAIAEFLDRETGKIDGLVAEQRRLMELLKEKRQAVISHAVTKGLNPHAPMKPSGIEWLGEVPVEWEVSKISAIADILAGHSFDASLFGSEGTPVIRMSDFGDGSVRLDVAKRVEPTNVPKKSLAQAGDILLGLSGSISNFAEVSEHDLPIAINQRVAIVRINVARRPLVTWFLQSAEFLNQITAELPETTIQNVSMGQLRRCRIPLPPLIEQTTIVSHLTTETAKLAALIAEAQRAIDLLQERRTALISAAVTGQIDVRQHPKN